MSEDLYYSPYEIAKIVKVSKKTVMRMIEDGTLPAFKFRGQWRVKSEDFERVLKNE